MLQFPDAARQKLMFERWAKAFDRRYMRLDTPLARQARTARLNLWGGALERRHTFLEYSVRKRDCDLKVAQIWLNDIHLAQDADWSPAQFDRRNRRLGQSNQN